LGFPSMHNVEALWRKLDGCPANANAAKSSTTGAIQNTTWGPCADGSAVQLDIINGGIHVWPGSSGLAQTTPDRQMNASAVIWSFFSKHVAGSLKVPSATVTRVQVHKAGTRRSLITTFRLGEGVTVSAFAYRGGHRVAKQGAKFSQAGVATLRVRLPGRVDPGRYTERVTLGDAYGRVVTVSRSVNVT
jgi:hypothetical protein